MGNIKIQPTVTFKIENKNLKSALQGITKRSVEYSERSIKARRIPNSVGVDSDYYTSKSTPKKVHIEYLKSDKEKMKNMSEVERKCYEAYLILTGNYKTI